MLVMGASGHFIIQHSSGKCVHPRGGDANPSNGRHLAIGAICDTASDAQLFQKLLQSPTAIMNPISATANYFRFQHMSSKCVHPRGGDIVPADGTPLVLHEACDTAASEKLSFTTVAVSSDHFIIQHKSGKCVQPQSGNDNPSDDESLVFDVHCDTASAAQLFMLVMGASGHFILQHSSGKCVHPRGGDANPPNGRHLAVGAVCDTASDAQLFQMLWQYTSTTSTSTGSSTSTSTKPPCVVAALPECGCDLSGIGWCNHDEHCFDEYEPWMTWCGTAPPPTEPPCVVAALPECGCDLQGKGWCNHDEHCFDEYHAWMTPCGGSRRLVSDQPIGVVFV
jgi:hypothetical protein